VCPGDLGIRATHQGPLLCAISHPFSRRLPAGASTLGPAADWRWNRDATGRTAAYLSVDATGVGVPGEGGARAEGRMAWVGKVFNPRPEPAEGPRSRTHPRPATRPG
jgi:hypothetical protein